MKKVKDISVGDYVGLLDSKEKGYVVSIKNGMALVHTKEGFEISHPLVQLVKYDINAESLPSIYPLVPEPARSPEKKTVEVIRKKKNEYFPAEKKPVIKKVVDPDFKVPLSYLGEEKKKVSVKTDKTPKWEIDLHIEELVDRYQHLTNTEILDIQLKHVRMVIEKAVRHKMSRLVFIHGKGKGVLRGELLYLLSTYIWLEYFDASFKEYGGGATEIRIFLNKAK